MLKLAKLIGRQPWIVTVGPRFAKVDNLVQSWTGGWLSVMRLAGLTSVVLTTTGRRTDLPRSSVLLAVPDGGSLLVVASNFGKPGHPDWSANLIANPNATVHMRGRAFAVRGKLLTGDERAAAWSRATVVWPGYDGYAARTDREIRVFRITLSPPLRN